MSIKARERADSAGLADSSGVTASSKVADTSAAATTPRQSNFELLRIIAILFIVIEHVMRTVFDASASPWADHPIYSFIILCTNWLGGVGNALFFTITGYFAASSGTNWRRLLKVMLPVWFWAITLFITGAAIGHFITLPGGQFPALANGPFSQTFINYILFGNGWFQAMYVMLYALSIILLPRFLQLRPRAQIALAAASFIIGHAIFFAFTNFLPQLGSIALLYDLAGACSYLWCILFGAIISQNLIHIRKSIFITASISAAAILMLMIHFSLPASSMFAQLASALIFYAFSRIRLQSRAINIIAKPMFDVYLLHGGVMPTILGIFLMGPVSPLLNSVLTNSTLTLLWPFLGTLLIFSIGELLGHLRLKLFKLLQL